MLLYFFLFSLLSLSQGFLSSTSRSLSFSQNRLTQNLPFKPINSLSLSPLFFKRKEEVALDFDLFSEEPPHTSSTSRTLDKLLRESDVSSLSIEDQKIIFTYLEELVRGDIREGVKAGESLISSFSSSDLLLRLNRFLLSEDEERVWRLQKASRLPEKFYRLLRLFYLKETILILIHNMVENSDEMTPSLSPYSSSLPLSNFIPLLHAVSDSKSFGLSREETVDALSLAAESLKSKLQRDKESGFLTVEENERAKESFSEKYSLFNILGLPQPLQAFSNTTEDSPSNKLLKSSVFRESSLLFFLSEKLLLRENKSESPSFYESIVKKFNGDEKENQNDLYFSSNPNLFNDFHSKNLFLHLNFFPFDWYSLYLQSMSFNELYTKVQELIHNFPNLNPSEAPSNYLQDLWSFYGDQLDQSGEMNQISNRVNGYMMKKIIVDVIKQAVRKDLITFLPQSQLFLLREIDNEELKRRNPNQNNSSTLSFPTLENFDHYLNSAAYLMLEEVEVERMIRNVTLDVASNFIEENILEKLYENISANQISSNSQLESQIQEARYKIALTLSNLHLSKGKNTIYKDGEDVKYHFQHNIIYPLLKKLQNQVENTYELLNKQRLNKLQVIKGRNSTNSDDLLITENNLLDELHDRLLVEVRVSEACLQGALASLNATDHNAHLISLNGVDSYNSQFSSDIKDNFLGVSVIQNLSTSVKLKLYETFIKSQTKLKEEIPFISNKQQNQDFLKIISKISKENETLKSETENVDDVLISNPSILFSLNQTDIISTNREVLHPHLVDFHRSVIQQDLNSSLVSSFPSIQVNFTSGTVENVNSSFITTKKSKRGKTSINEGFISESSHKESIHLRNVLHVSQYHWTISSLDLFFDHFQTVIQFQNQLNKLKLVSSTSKESIESNIFSDLSESSGVKLSQFLIDHLKRVQNYLGLSVQSIFSYAFHKSSTQDPVSSLTKSTLDSFISILDGDIHGDSSLLHQLCIIAASNYNPNGRKENDIILPTTSSSEDNSASTKLIDLIETHPDKIYPIEILANINKIKEYFLDNENSTSSLESFNMYIDQAFVDISIKHFEKLDQIFDFMANKTLSSQYEKNIGELIKTNPQLQHTVIDNLKHYYTSFYNTSTIISDASTLSPQALRNLCLHELSVISKLKLLHPNFKDSLLDNAISQYFLEKYKDSDESKKKIDEAFKLSLEQVPRLVLSQNLKERGSKIIELFNFSSDSKFSDTTTTIKKNIISDILVERYSKILLKTASDIWSSWANEYVNNAEKIFLEDAVSGPILIKETEDSFFLDILGTEEPIKRSSKKLKPDSKTSISSPDESKEDLNIITQELVNNQSIYSIFKSFSSSEIESFDKDYSFLFDLYGLSNKVDFNQFKYEIMVEIMRLHFSNLLQDFKHLDNLKNNFENRNLLNTDSISTTAIRSAAKDLILKPQISPELVALIRLQSENFGLKLYEFDFFQTKIDTNTTSTNNTINGIIPSFESFIDNLSPDIYSINSSTRASNLLINLLSLELDGCLSRGLSEKACLVELSYSPILKKNDPSMLAQTIALKGALSSSLAALNGDQSNPITLPPASRCRMLNQALNYLKVLPRKYYNEIDFNSNSESSTILDALLNSISKSYLIYHKNKSMKSNSMKLLKTFKNFVKFAYKNDIQEFKKFFKKDKCVLASNDDQSNFQTLAKCDPNCDLGFYISRNCEETFENETKYDYEKSRKTWAWG